MFHSVDCPRRRRQRSGIQLDSRKLSDRDPDHKVVVRTRKKERGSIEIKGTIKPGRTSNLEVECIYLHGRIARRQEWRLSGRTGWVLVPMLTGHGCEFLGAV